MRSSPNLLVVVFVLFCAMSIAKACYSQPPKDAADKSLGLDVASSVVRTLSGVDRVRNYLQAGEFKVARELAQSLQGNDRDEALVEVARAEKAEGFNESAIRTLMSTSPTLRMQRIGELAGPMRLQEASSESYLDRARVDGKRNEQGDSGAAQDQASGGDGGAAIADFDSLMELIRNTIAPDTWDSVGGPSTMSPYRAGIHVDLDGIVRDVEILDQRDANRFKGNLLENFRDPQFRSQGDWTMPSDLRVVSLRRLGQAWAVRRAAGLVPTLSMQNLAGLSEIQYVVIEDDDLLLAGSVGGIDASAIPWPRDLKSGQVPLGLDILAAASQAVSRRISYGCSIDPTPQGLASVQKVRRDILDGSVPVALRANRLAEAMGAQAITLIGVRSDSPLAWLMVETDRHMKQLALGVHQMPDGVMSYLDVVSSQVKQRGEDAGQAGTLLRMWFAPQAKKVRRGIESQTYELAGRPIRLVTAKELADLQGDRSQVGEDPLGQAFAKQFNENYRTIASRYPNYDRLRGAFEITAALQLVRNEIGAPGFDTLTQVLQAEGELAHWHLRVPRMCETLAVRHNVTSNRKRHEFYFASGGIDIEPAASLETVVEPYPQLDDHHQRLSARPQAQQSWWWNAAEGNR